MLYMHETVVIEQHQWRKHWSLVINKSYNWYIVSKFLMRFKVLKFINFYVSVTYILRSTVSENDPRLSIPPQCRSCLSDDPWNFYLWNRENDNNDCCLFAMLDLCTCDYCRRGRNCDIRAIDKTVIRNWQPPLISRYHSGVAVKRSSLYLHDDLASRADSCCIYNNSHIVFLYLILRYLIIIPQTFQRSWDFYNRFEKVIE